MNLTTILAGLSFPQLLLLIFLVLAPLVGVAVFAISRGVSFRNWSFGSNGKSKKPSSTPQSVNVLLLLEALKIKDDIYSVDRLVIQRQKRYARDALARARETQLLAFKNLLFSRRQNSENEKDRDPDWTENRDYLYYSLLLEKMYSSIFSSMMNSFEENGLAVITRPREFARSKVEAQYRKGFDVLNSFFTGINEVSKPEHDREMGEMYDKCLEPLIDAYTYAIQVAHRGQEKKKELKSFLFDKVNQLEGISPQQLENFFSDIMPEDLTI